MTSTIKGPLIARGRTAEVYAWQEGQVLKLFYEWCPANWVEHELQVANAVARTTLPTPRVLGTVQFKDRQGIVYERVEGPSLLKMMSRRPWQLSRLTHLFAELHAQVHKESGDGFRPLRSGLEKTIRQVNCLPDLMKQDVLKVLDQLPDGNALCHFDFHPDQVLLTGRGPVIIDWMTAYQGDALADVARTAIILQFGRIPYVNGIQRALADFVRGQFYQGYISRYFEADTSVDQQKLRKWMIPVAAARLNELIPGEEKPLVDLIHASLYGQAAA